MDGGEDEGGPEMRVIIDTREKTPFPFGPDVETEPGTLATGDYSLAGLENLVAVERKSLADLVMCCGSERDRFKRELQRLRAYRCRAVVIEAHMAEVIYQKYRGNMVPAAIMGSVASWQTRYEVPFVWAGKHGAAFTAAIFRNFLHQLREITDATAAQVEHFATDRGTAQNG